MKKVRKMTMKDLEREWEKLKLTGMAWEFFPGGFKDFVERWNRRQ